MARRNSISVWITYLLYASFFAAVAAVCIQAKAMIPGRQSTLTPECVVCLDRLASCMDFAEKSADIRITNEIKRICVLKEEACASENLCKPLRERLALPLTK